MSLMVRSGIRRKMRIVSSKASYETTSSIAEKLMEISKMEGKINRLKRYRAMSLMEFNKSYKKKKA